MIQSVLTYSRGEIVSEFNRFLNTRLDKDTRSLVTEYFPSAWNFDVVKRKCVHIPTNTTSVAKLSKNQIVSGSVDKKIRVWNLDNKEGE